MVLGQIGVDGVSAVRLVEEAGEREIGSVHLLCMGGGPVLGKLLRLIAAGTVAATVRKAPQ